MFGNKKWHRWKKIDRVKRDGICSNYSYLLLDGFTMACNLSGTHTHTFTCPKLKDPSFEHFYEKANALSYDISMKAIYLRRFIIFFLFAYDVMPPYQFWFSQQYNNLSVQVLEHHHFSFHLFHSCKTLENITYHELILFNLFARLYVTLAVFLIFFF